MLVDDNIFCGSLNLANSYTSVRYGDGSFRDINIILKGHPAKRVRDFFRDILLRNEKYWPEKINAKEVNAVFDDFDVKYAWQEAEAPFPNGWPDAAQEAKLSQRIEQMENLIEEIDKAAATANANEETSKGNSQMPREEVSVFLEQTPPDRSDVSNAVLEMIKRAEKNIKIIQPYVTNVDEFEDLVVQAARDRKVDVEIITARIRDQPCYQSFLNSDIFRRMLKECPDIKVYEEPYKFLHMKAVVVDDGRYITLGSLNQDTWSFYCNNEANVLLVNEGANTRPPTLAYTTFLRVFMNLQRECRPVDRDEWYTPMGKIENLWWRFFLACSYFAGKNRDR